MKAAAGLNATSTEVSGDGCRCHVNSQDKTKHPFTSLLPVSPAPRLSCPSESMRGPGTNLIEKAVGPILRLSA